MNFSRPNQTAATPSAPTMSQHTARVSPEPTSHSPSPSLDNELASVRPARVNRGSTFWEEPIYFDHSLSATPVSSPPYTRQTSMVDLRDIKKEPEITFDSKGGQDPEPYHVFSHRMKWAIVILIGVAGLFSGLSSNIYFPALDAIAKVRTYPPKPYHEVGWSCLLTFL